MSGPASVSTPLPSSALPVVNQALEPAWVRRGSASVQKAYQTALSFEEMLVEQLSHSLTATSGLGGESGEEGESSPAGSPGAGAGPLASMLPQALTSGVMNAGGLGLAAQMTRQLESASGVAQVRGSTTGGTAPTAGASTVGDGAASGASASAGADS